MDKSAKQYREEKAEALAEMTAMADVVKKEERAFSEEELTQYDALDARQAQLDMSAKSIERIEKLGSYVKQSQERPIMHAETGKKVTVKDVDLALRAFCLINTEYAPTDDMRRAADKLELNLNANTFSVKFEQTTDSNTQGGYLRNDSIFSGIETAQKAYGGVRSVAKVLTTGTGETIHLATVDDTSNKAAAHTEVASVGNTDVVFGRIQLGAFSIATSIFPVALELINDSQFPLSPYLGEILGERIARKKNDLYTNGVETSTEPTGFLVDTVLGSTATNNAIVADDLYDLYFSVDQAYRSSPSCAWMMNDATLAAIVSMDDLDGRPLWGAGLNQSPGSMLLGKPIVVNNDMPIMTATERYKVIAFGDFSKFYIREVGPVLVRKLEERYAAELAIGVLGWHRIDSKLIDAGQNPIKHLLATDSGSS